MHSPFQDNNECMLFTLFIFQESLEHLEKKDKSKSPTEKTYIFPYMAEEIEKRKENINKLVAEVPSLIISTLFVKILPSMQE